MKNTLTLLFEKNVFDFSEFGLQATFAYSVDGNKYLFHNSQLLHIFAVSTGLLELSG